ncbi:MAG TPA: TauD/TfdA family dioxygenase [Rhodopila sp.]|uniref:TauD/TfdA dioxygenase family protein n=1 Tax=Rhodopila sp. TaxID=2480087 RepID=UPI002B9336B6|nr:TauD/TfdA family dioxygenase [Rhodopila sp.]HVY17225.1 TauD/TfdA family dioxygenase [Rhodopila sp.]
MIDWREELAQRGLGVSDLTPKIASRIDGLDLAEPWDDGLTAALRTACAERVVLLFRGQQALPPAGFLAFARRFGDRFDLHSQRHYCLDDHHEIFVVGNAEESGKRVGASRVGLNWHTDHYHLPEPGLFTFLHALVVPPEAGETRYANGLAAYEALPTDKRAAIDGLDVRHSRATLFKALFPEANEEALAAERAKMPDVVHPLVRHHPELGRDGLYLGGEWGSEIVASDPNEASRLYADLLNHLIAPEFVYEHHWQPGDVLMSDNRCSMHRATEWDESAHQRRLHRIILIDDAPPVAGRAAA